MSESQEIINASAGRVETLTDANGRQIEVRKLPRRELMRLMRQWGTASNVETWLALAIVVASVVSIDGKPFPSPRTAEQVEGLMEVLGVEGSQVVERWMMDSQGEADLALARTDAKNLPRTPS